MAEQTGAELALRDDVVWRDGEDSVLVLDARTSLYLSVGGAGPLLWPMLVEGTTQTGLAAVLVETFALDDDTAARDVAAFVDGLRAYDLLAG